MPHNSFLSPPGVPYDHLHPLEKEAFAAKMSDMAPFIGFLGEYDRCTGWFIDKEVNPPATMIASTDPVSAVRWIKKVLSTKEWLAIFDEDADPKEQQSVKEKGKESHDGDRGELSDGGIEDEDLL
jgi:hypothetical protein